MAFGTRPDLLSQCLSSPTQLSSKIRNGEGIAGLVKGYGEPVQGKSRSIGGSTAEPD